MFKGDYEQSETADLKQPMTCTHSSNYLTEIKSKVGDETQDKL